MELYSKEGKERFGLMVELSEESLMSCGTGERLMSSLAQSLFLFLELGSVK